jgi:hypothetical protein
MKTFIIQSKLGKSYIKEFKDREECRHWIINTLDLSLVWSFHEQIKH